ncbi:MAG TPA: hypothetical protein DEG47_31870, partial [Cyanobacteria bacterium UBA11148]|nr:hypothetical protein [Cyanobacteria bacterium UBA11148]
YWLLVIGCWLLVIGCWLLVIGCWLLVNKIDVWLLFTNIEQQVIADKNQRNLVHIFLQEV